MSLILRKSTFICLVTFFCLGLIRWSVATDSDTAVSKINADSENAVEAVDKDMHHFMEYIFEPNYKRLKAAMATEPKEKATYKAIKGDSLTLAECANLLLTRAPEEDAEDWKQRSLAVRKHGGELYQAARKSDYASARSAYVNMLNNCNACHKQFAGGKHQLKP